MSAFTEAYRKIFPSATVREVYNIKPQAKSGASTVDEDLAAELKRSAQRTAELAGELRSRGWQVTVDIYPSTSDKGPIAHVRVYRTHTLASE